MKSQNNVALNNFAFTAGRSVELPSGNEGGGLTVESAEDQVSFTSDFNIKRDASGLALARDLVDILLGAIQTMKEDQQASRLPQILTSKKATVRDNPLA